MDVVMRMGVAMKKGKRKGRSYMDVKKCEFDIMNVRVGIMSDGTIILANVDDGEVYRVTHVERCADYTQILDKGGCLEMLYSYVKFKGEPKL